MVEDKNLKLIQFIVATAQYKNGNGLGTIHIVKYLYIVDYFNSRSENTTLTNWNWKYWIYGPWSLKSYDAVVEAVAEGYIQSKSLQSKHTFTKVNESNEYQFFFCNLGEITSSKLEELGKKVIPNVRTRIALESIIKKYGSNTNPLLNYVYSRTEPMLDVKKGDILNFENLSWPEGNKSKKTPIKKRTLKKAKAIIAKIKAEKPPGYHPPSGKFDDIYIAGMEILDSSDLLEEGATIEAIACVKDILSND